MTADDLKQLDETLALACASDTSAGLSAEGPFGTPGLVEVWVLQNAR